MSRRKRDAAVDALLDDIDQTRSMARRLMGFANPWIREDARVAAKLADITTCPRTPVEDAAGSRPSNAESWHTAIVWAGQPGREHRIPSPPPDDPAMWGWMPQLKAQELAAPNTVERCDRCSSRIVDQYVVSMVTMGSTVIALAICLPCQEDLGISSAECARMTKTGWPRRTF